MTIVIKKAGIQTSVQDIGRFGSSGMGVQVSGAMDSFSLQVANILVGNKFSDPGLEIAITGPILEFKSDAIIAITGASFELMLDGKLLPMYRPILVFAGSKLSFGTRQKGSRAYLSIKGGFDVPSVLGSSSTNLLEGFGGYYGRVLKTGDELHSKNLANLKISQAYRTGKVFYSPPWGARNLVSERLKNPQVIRFIPTEFWNKLSFRQKKMFTNKEYKVANGSNRMAYRLEGGNIVGGQGDELSRPTVFGAIQLPPDGNPIVLMADCQTVGGYSVLGVAISYDHLLLAQLAPGDQVGFEVCGLDMAHSLLAMQKKYLRELRLTIKNQRFWDEEIY